MIRMPASLQNDWEELNAASHPGLRRLSEPVTVDRDTWKS
jgi:hypothetical protein